MNKIEYFSGDCLSLAAKAEGTLAIIPHCCNNIGRWGSGFVVAVSKKWNMPERQYRSKISYQLGTVDFVQVQCNALVANMIGQHGTHWKDGIPPIRIDALEKCMIEVSKKLNKKTEIHCPKFGAGLAGGDWNEIEKLIIKHWLPISRVVVYEFTADEKEGQILKDRRGF